MGMIYLDDAIEAIASRDETDGTCNVFSGKQVIDILKDLPSAQPERLTGKWIEYISEHGKCPFCGNQVDLLGGKANNFCGECGADMRSKEHTMEEFMYGQDMGNPEDGSL